MINDIKELNFPSYATLTKATVNISDMGEMTITADVRIDGDISPDFSYDWEVMFHGERYIMPLRKPQCSKENTSTYSTVELTFYHWAVYEMKRNYFAEMTSTESGTAIVSKYEVPLSLSLSDFVLALNKVLNYYYKGSIVAELNPEWISGSEKTTLNISYTYIWDLLTSIYENYSVRWYLKTNEDGVCVIKIGFPAEEISHVFEYGFDGGLLKVERQVQSSDIRNILLGRGGNKNLPYRYFKDVDDANKSFNADPDWIPELENIYFSELRDAAFRSYVQGWKAKHYGGTVTKENAYVPWAWEKGYTDTYFNPVEYVKDDESIKSYGELYGAVETNEDIYPTIQGVEIEPYGRIDEVVDVENIISEEEQTEQEVEVRDVKFFGQETQVVPTSDFREFIFPFTDEERNEGPDYDVFVVPSGKVSNLIPPKIDVSASKGNGDRHDYAELVEIKADYYAQPVGGTSADWVPVSGIGEGSYYLGALITARNLSSDNLEIIITVRNFSIQIGDKSNDAPHGTFNVWVKNIWGTSKETDEEDYQYEERVWLPIIGDRSNGDAKLVFSDGWLSLSEDYEFTIIGVPKFDTSKSLNGVDSHWRITLAKSDAEYDATGKYIPNENTNASAGDHFFFTGIDIPYIYYVEAEKRLTAYKEEALEDVKDINPTWDITFDRVRIANKQDGEDVPLISKIKVGASIKIDDKRFITDGPKTLFVQSITYTYRESTSDDAALIPDVSVVLSDKVYATENKIGMIQGQVDAMEKQLGSLSNIKQVIQNTCDSRYFRKDISDVSDKLARFHGGVSTTKIKSRRSVPTEKGIGFSFDEDEIGRSKGYVDSLTVRDEGTIRKVISEIVGSKDFIDGFAGEGFRIWKDDNGNWCLTVDVITARRSMIIYELLISKIRSVGGQIVVSASNGKVVYVYEEGDNYVIKFEEKNTFEVNDLVRCQTWTGSDVKSYWVEVSALTDDGYGIIVPKSEFTNSVPKEGDEIVLMGSTTNEKRQNVILISATEDGKPRVDVLNGIKEKSLEGSLRARLGNLEDIVDPWFPDGVNGDGLYSDNVYLRGKFQFSNCQDLETRFSITDGNIQSSVEALREDFVEEKGFLSNPSFNRGLESWEIDDAAMLYETGQTCIIANSELLSTKESGAALMYDDSRRVMRIKNTSIIQRNAAMRAKPEIVKDTDGIGEPALIHFSVLVKVISAGTLNVGFDGETTEGFHSFLPFSQRKDLAQSDSYQMVTMSGVWTGTGDFKFEFSGELYAYNFIITSDPVEAFTYRYKSLFEQSARLTKLAVAAYGKDKDEREQLMKETGLMITPDGSGIYFRKSDGTMAFISVEEENDGSGNTVVKLKGDNIKLEGNLTANGNFKVLGDGSIETNNAKLKGYMYSVFKPIVSSDAERIGLNKDDNNVEYLLKSNLCVDATFNGIVLPVSEEYEGARVLIMDANFHKSRIPTPPTTIRTADGSNIISGFFRQKPGTYDKWDIVDAEKLYIDCGTVELILYNCAIRDEETGEVTSYSLRWILIGNSCQTLSYKLDGTMYDYKYNH